MLAFGAVSAQDRVWRGRSRAGMRVMFILYGSVIVAGIAFYVAVGLTQP